MDIRKIAVGGAFWFAGILVPVFQHGMIAIAAGARGDRYASIPYNYDETLPLFTICLPSSGCISL